MRTLAEIRSEAATIHDLASRIKAISAERVAATQKIEADKDRSQSWKQTELSKIRNDTRAADLFKELRTRYDAVVADRGLWASPYFTLSRMRFFPVTDAATEAAEATVRMNFRAELQAMPVAAAKIVIAEAASNRDFARVWQGILVLGLPELPFSLEVLPLASVEEADDVFFEIERDYRSATIDEAGLRGTRDNSQSIALGLLTMEYQRKKSLRQKGWVLSLDEKKRLGLDRPQALEDMLNPKPMNVTLARQSDAGFAPTHMEAIQPGEIPGH